MAATLDQVLADVTAETTTIGGIQTLITGLQAQLAAALANVTIPPAVQTEIDSIFSVAEANKAALATALAANVKPPVVQAKK